MRNLCDCGNPECVGNFSRNAGIKLHEYLGHLINGAPMNGDQRRSAIVCIIGTMLGLELKSASSLVVAQVLSAIVDVMNDTTGRDDIQAHSLTEKEYEDLMRPSAAAKAKFRWHGEY